MPKTLVLPQPTGHNFTMIQRSLALDERLTLEQRGLLLVLLTVRGYELPPIEDVLDELPERSEHVRMLIQDLLAFGYLNEVEYGDDHIMLQVFDRPIGHRVDEYQDAPPPAADKNDE